MNDHSQHRARKRFGQNFLHDNNIIDKIIRAIHPRETDCIIEIGPGMGALTSALLEMVPHIDAVEIDRDLITLLNEKFDTPKQLTIHNTDALKFDFSSLITDDKKCRIVGNLPYNISTPLIFHLLRYESIIQDMHFMLQKEVVERMAATVGSRNYGRLSVMVQYHCAVENLFRVSPHAFIPAPKVESAIVRLIPHEQKPHVADDLDTFSTVVRTAFNQRRKTLRNSLKSLIPDTVLSNVTIDLSQRPEQIGIDGYIQISNALYNSGT